MEEKPNREERPKLEAQKGPQSTYLRSSADIAVFGGAAGGGKSFAILLEAARHYKKSGYNAVIFRRSYPQIMKPGGLWDGTVKMYPHIGGTPKISECSWHFPSGAKIQCAHLQHATSVLDWHGSELTFIGFDELTQFSADQFWYMLSRNRSTCGVRPYVRATCNPDPDSWVATFLSWWIDQETGQPIPERAGKVRWFVRVNDALVWADTPDELRAKYPAIPPKSVSFVPAKLSDNRILMAADPGYLANLLALPMVERERLLGGNWKIRPAAGLVFNRGWFDLVDVAPVESVRVRYWDKAGTAGAGDYTAGVRMSRSPEGLYYIEDVVRGQWSSGQRNNVILQTAQLDGPDCEIWVEQEPGSSGKESAEISLKQLAGYIVHAERVTGDKVTRAKAFSAQAEAHNVKIVKGYHSTDWIEAFLAELHGFPEAAHDDMVDAASGAFNKLAVIFADGWDTEPTPGANPESLVSRMPGDVFLPDYRGY